MLYHFIVLDGLISLATLIISLFPSKSCPPIVCSSTATRIDLDVAKCRIYGSFTMEYAIAALLCSVFKMIMVGITIAVLLRRRSRSAASPQHVDDAQKESAAIDLPTAYFLRLLPTAIAVPVFGFMMMNFTAMTHPRDAVRLNELLDCGLYHPPEVWPAITVLYVITAVLFVAEVIAFYIAPQLYTRRRCRAKAGSVKGTVKTSSAKTTSAPKSQRQRQRPTKNQRITPSEIR